MELLQKDLNDLREERNKLQSHIEDARILLHPIRTLSDDILYEIFVLCVPEWGALETKLLDEPEYSSLNSSNAPWTLSRVCSGWRRVALSAPRLWSAVIFTCPFPTQNPAGTRKLDRLSRFCYNLGLFMARSGNTDLSVAITIPPKEIISDMICVPLAVAATRWRRLRLEEIGGEYPIAFSGLYVERLEEVILCGMEEARIVGKALLHPFQSAPRLSTVRLLQAARAVDYPPVPSITLPWSQITHYEHTLPSMALDTLSQMTRLERLTLKVKRYVKDGDQRNKITVPRLSCLSVTLRSPIFPELFSLLDLPALVDLRLTYQSTKSNLKHWKEGTFIPITNTFPARLSSLHIACDIRQDEGLVSWLRAAANVSRLSFHLPSIPDTLVDHLLVQASGHALVPRLKSLELGTDSDMQMPTTNVLSVLESRSGLQHNVSRLEEFSTNVDAGRFSEGSLQRWQDVCRTVKVICPR